MSTDVNACNCGQGCMDTVRVCTESRLWEKNPLPHRGIEPASDMCWSDALTNWATSPPHAAVLVCHVSCCSSGCSTSNFGYNKTRTGTGTLTALMTQLKKHIHCSSCSTSCLLASQDTIKSKLILGHSVHTMTQLRTHSFIIYSRISMRSLSKAGHVSLEPYLK